MDFRHCSSISIVEFQQVNAGWLCAWSMVRTRHSCFCLLLSNLQSIKRVSYFFCWISSLTQFASGKEGNIWYQENEDFSGSNMAIFSKSSIIDVWEHPKYASVLGREFHSQQFKRVVKYQLFLERICRPCVNFISVFSNDRSSRPEVFCKKGILKNFAELTGK